MCRFIQKRSSLALSHLNNLVYIKYNRTLKRHYDACDTIDAIALDNIDEANEWSIVLGDVLEVQGRLTRARSTYYYIYKFKSDSDPNLSRICRGRR